MSFWGKSNANIFNNLPHVTPNSNCFSEILLNICASAFSIWSYTRVPYCQIPVNLCAIHGSVNVFLQISVCAIHNFVNFLDFFSNFTTSTERCA